jgi:zinc finger SWIM domain-containing protein 3
MNMDDECRLRNVFWVDVRSRTAYEDFGNVITFDTMYLTYRYGMSFAPFVRVNHYGQSFVWLFDTWFGYMNG